jgi:RPA family protein
MGKGTLEKFTLTTIADALRGSDVESARGSLSELVGADVPGFVVFADCGADAETVTNSKIRKGSSVAVRGKFQTFGALAVCLSDCRIVEKC